jgi:hypothetical protein
LHELCHKKKNTTTTAMKCAAMKGKAIKQIGSNQADLALLAASTWYIKVCQERLA